MNILTTSRMERRIGCHSCSLACTRLIHKSLSWDTAGIRISSSGGLSTEFEARNYMACDPAPCVDAADALIVQSFSTLLAELRALIFLLLNLAGKSVAKYIGTSLDWADNRKEWDSRQVRPDQVLEGTGALSLNEAHLQFLAGSPYQDDEP